MNKPLNPWNLPEYKAGQNLTCRVERQERDGYIVTISKDNWPGFLSTEESLKIGDEILAQFICISNNRILLTTRFSNINTNAARPINYIDWQDQLNSTVAGIPALTEESAALLWAHQLAPQHVHLRRATDLILPPLNPADIETFTIAEHDAEWLITDLEGGMRSGCLKASSESRLSRSGMLLYRGRCVGCIYSNKQMPECPAQEEALLHILSDLKLQDSKVTLYDLPESLVLAASAVFLGEPVENHENLDTRNYFDYTLDWLDKQKHTACLTLSLTNRLGHCFVYVYRGLYVGAFYVEDQKFNQDRNYVYQIFEEDSQVILHVQILPPEMTSAAVRFGSSLSIAAVKRDSHISGY
jgi:hypothetical protein